MRRLEKSSLFYFILCVVYKDIKKGMAYICVRVKESSPLPNTPPPRTVDNGARGVHHTLYHIYTVYARMHRYSNGALRGPTTAHTH